MKSGNESSWKRKSWIESANAPECGFPLQNLPFCAFGADDGTAHLGIGIGDLVLDLEACASAGLLNALSEQVQRACTAPTLNLLMQCGHEAASALRRELMLLLQADGSAAVVTQIKPLLQPMKGTDFRLPVHIGNYTDFYASVHHATNVGRLFRPDNPLLPNYKHVPIGYHGRASSIVVSGTPVLRPSGQIMPPSSTAPTFAATHQLDYELEVGAYIGSGNPLGQPIDISAAEQHIFGFSLVNDWSARDIQAWEYQPLGPFLGKSFATSVSPWVISLDALEPFRVPLAPRPEGDPEPLPYLRSPAPLTEAFNVDVEVRLSTAVMRARGLPRTRLSAANLRDLYWSFPQMVAHHTSNGCNLQSGDLLASGTISGPEEGAQGCLLEITRRGQAPLTLPSGEQRSFLEDGDEVIVTGVCRREGLPSISLGECRGTVLPART